jgi:polyvinyl alcohol dehydrogenase (cytochrome)
MPDSRGLLPIAAVALGALVAAAGASARTGDWPSYGRDLANSRSAGATGPSVQQAPQLRQLWRFRDPDGDFTGTPVVVDGLLVAGSNDGSPGSAPTGGRVFALDAATGETIWSRDVGAPVNGSAAIAGGRVYVPVATVSRPHVMAFDLADGGLLWDAVVDTQKDSDVYGSPVVWRDTVYIGVSAFFGEFQEPDVAVRGSVVALDARTGRRRWKTYTVPKNYDGASVWTTPAIDAATGRLYAGTGNAYHEPAYKTTDSVIALDARDGRLIDVFQATPNDVWNATTNVAKGPDADFGASPNLITSPSGRKLVGEGQKSGTYWALDRATLDPVWQTSTGPGSQAGGIVGGTAYDGKRIYGPHTPGGKLFALGRDGDIDWTSADGDPAHFAPVSVANGVLYTQTSTAAMTARNADSGTPITAIPLDGPALGGVSIADGTVFAVSGSQRNGTGSIYAFRAPSQGPPPRRTVGQPAPPEGKSGPKGRRVRRARLRVRVRPRRVRAGRRVRFRFTVRSLSGFPVARARVHFAGKRTRTNSAGRARIVVRLRQAGRRKARVSKAGYARRRATVSVRRRR